MAGSDAQVLDLAGREVRITSPDKVLFSERGETKLDLVRYYAAVQEPLMRAMGGRPVLMQRFPKGAGGPSFFQKRVPDGAPEWLQTTTVQTVNGTPSRALVAADVAHVAWAVNLACLGFHVWPNRAEDDEHADELRLDLDPQPGTGFAEAREAARELKALLDELGIAGFPKTTGNRGLHVYVRLAPRWDSYAVRSAAVAAARELERRRPDILTAAWWKEERGRRIFIDYNQNAPHKTVFGAWSVRARAGAQVSTPIRWEELDDVEPDELTLASVPTAWSATAIRGPRSTPHHRRWSPCWRCTSATARTACSMRRGRRSTPSSPTSRRGWRRAGPARRSNGRSRPVGRERQHLVDRAAQRPHRRRVAARHAQDEHDRPVALEPDDAPERAGRAGQRGALPSLQRVAVLEQALEQERRAPRMDGELAARRLEPQPHEPAAGVEQRGPVDGRGAQHDGAGRRGERVAGGVAQAPAAVEPGEEVHAGAGAQDVHGREVGAVELERGDVDAVARGLRLGGGEAQLADQVATQPRARGSARGRARPGRAPSSASASPATTRVSSGAPRRGERASSACAIGARRARAPVAAAPPQQLDRAVVAGARRSLAARAPTPGPSAATGRPTGSKPSARAPISAASSAAPSASSAARWRKSSSDERAGRSTRG